MSTSRSLNKVQLIGNLTRNPSLKDTTSGSQICTFGLATNTSWKNSDGQIQERTEYHNIVSWNKLAEICAKLLKTGMLVFVEGELRTRYWEDTSGVRHYRTEIKISEMLILDGKEREITINSEESTKGTSEDKVYDDTIETESEGEDLF